LVILLLLWYVIVLRKRAARHADLHAAAVAALNAAEFTAMGCDYDSDTYLRNPEALLKILEREERLHEAWCEGCRESPCGHVWNLMRVAWCVKAFRNGDPVESSKVIDRMLQSYSCLPNNLIERVKAGVKSSKANEAQVLASGQDSSNH